MNTGTPKTEPSESNSENVKVIAPDYSLKKLIGEDVDIRQLFNPEKIEKAQNVIDTHKDNFLDWVKNDLAALEESYATAAQNPNSCEDPVKKLAKTAFVIKSQAGTFGYLLGTQLAKSLDDFCNRDFVPTPEHLTVIRKHIDALQAIFIKQIAGDGGMVGNELTKTLNKLVEKYKSKK